MLDLINKNIRLHSFKLGDRFQSASPFPHLVLDNFFDDRFVQNLLEHFPVFDPSAAMNELGLVGKKAVNTNFADLKQPYKELDELFKSSDFLMFMSTITAIPELLYDPEYIGGGTHENLEGQELDPHVDFNYHPGRKWHRRLNLLVYLNSEWHESWGGNIELHSDPWNPDQNKIQSFMPLMNRCVIFETSERSWHGFKKIQFPDDKKGFSRKSIAIYFYTKNRPVSEIRPEHSTFYVHRPIPDQIRAGYTLKEEDVQELKDLLTRRDDWIKFLYDREIHFSSEFGLIHEKLAQALKGSRLKQFWKRLTGN
ncbi:2OG-Fe(II) oxygenase [bacterium]|nr:2OG-Fe(II) oxygenase [bacterium]